MLACFLFYFHVFFLVFLFVCRVKSYRTHSMIMGGLERTPTSHDYRLGGGVPPCLNLGMH